VVVTEVCCVGYDSKGAQPASNVAARINKLSFLIITSYSIRDGLLPAVKRSTRFAGLVVRSVWQVE
jgi:hypothetical protein